MRFGKGKDHGLEENQTQLGVVVLYISYVTKFRGTQVFERRKNGRWRNSCVSQSRKLWSHPFGKKVPGKPVALSFMKILIGLVAALLFVGKKALRYLFLY